MHQAVEVDDAAARHSARYCSHHYPLTSTPPPPTYPHKSSLQVKPCLDGAAGAEAEPQQTQELPCVTATHHTGM